MIYYVFNGISIPSAVKPFPCSVCVQARCWPAGQPPPCPSCRKATHPSPQLPPVLVPKFESCYCTPQNPGLAPALDFSLLLIAPHGPALASPATDQQLPRHGVASLSCCPWPALLCTCTGGSVTCFPSWQQPSHRGRSVWAMMLV